MSCHEILRAPFVVFTLVLAAACGGGLPPGECVELPINPPPQDGRSAEAVRRLDAEFFAQPRVEAWASNKEVEIAASYSFDEVDELGRVELAAVECRTDRCRVELDHIYFSREAAHTGRVAGSVVDGLLSKEPCAFYVPGTSTMRITSCDTLRKSVYVSCASRD